MKSLDVALFGTIAEDEPLPTDKGEWNSRCIQNAINVAGAIVAEIDGLRNAALEEAARIVEAYETVNEVTGVRRPPASDLVFIADTIRRRKRTT